MDIFFYFSRYYGFDLVVKLFLGLKYISNAGRLYSLKIVLRVNHK